MAPRTIGLARGMAHDSHIHHENYEFIDVEGSVPVPAFSRGPNLRSGELDPAVYDELTLGIAVRGSILEPTYIRGPLPSLVTNRGQVFRLGKQRSKACDELTRGIASTSHILLGNHTVNHTKALAPMSAQNCPRGLHPGVHLHRGTSIPSRHRPWPRLPPRKLEAHGSRRARPRNGSRWPHPSREPQDRSNQRINVRDWLLPSLDLPRRTTRPYSRATPRTASSLLAEHNEPGHTQAIKLPAAMRHHH
jgi:hypothetical protein